MEILSNLPSFNGDIKYEIEDQKAEKEETKEKPYSNYFSRIKETKEEHLQNSVDTTGNILSLILRF